MARPTLIPKNVVRCILPTGFALNVDTIEFKVANPEITYATNATKCMIVNSNGEIASIRTNRAKVPATSENHQVMYRTRSRGGLLTEISFSGSPYAALYGQNIWTCTNVKRVIREFLAHCATHMGLSVRDHSKNSMLEFVKLTRVDLAANLKFNSDREAEQFLADLRCQLGGSKTPISTCGSSIMICPRRGREYAVVLYNKGRELEQNRKRREQPGKEVIQELTGTVRIELRLRTAELTELGLVSPNAWTPKIARSVFRKYFRRLPIYDAISIPDKNALLKYPKKLRAPIAALSTGVLIDQLYSPSTAQRLRRKLRDRGLGFESHPALSRSIKIATDLLSQARIATAPLWMSRTSR